MGEQIVLGNTSIEVANGEFGRGYREGYRRFTTHHPGKPLIAPDVCGFLARNIYYAMITDRHRAEYIVGWRAALRGQGRLGPAVDYYTNAYQKVQATV